MSRARLASQCTIPIILAALTGAGPIAGCHAAATGGDPAPATTRARAEWADHDDRKVYAMATERLTLLRLRDSAFEEIADDALVAELDGRAGSYRPIAGSVFRVQAINDDYARLLEDSAGHGPFDYLGPVYARLDQLEPLEHLGRPIRYTEAGHDDRLVVVLRAPAPRVLLIEGDAVVQVAPAVLGRGVSGAPATPTSRLHPGLWLMRAWPSINMVPDGRRRYGRPGVSFVMSISRGSMPYGDAIYDFHGSPWHRWDELAAVPRFASDGCVNLPDARWRAFEIDGRELGFGELMFRWASASFLNPVTAESTQRGADTNELRPAMRILIVDLIEDLPAHLDTGRARRIAASYAEPSCLTLARGAALRAAPSDTAALTANLSDGMTLYRANAPITGASYTERFAGPGDSTIERSGSAWVAVKASADDAEPLGYVRALATMPCLDNFDATPLPDLD